MDTCKHIEKEVKNKIIKYCYELSCFTKVKSDKKCPYYSEHQLSEWNKK